MAKHFIERRVIPFLFVIGVGPGFFGACAHKQYADPSAEIQRLEKAQADARAQAVDVLSPTLYENASKELKKAKERADKGSDPWADLRGADRDLRKASETAEPARVALKDVLDARAKALAADAPDWQRNDWDRAEQRLKRSTDDVGRGDLRAVEKNRHDLAVAYENVEINAIVSAQLNQAKDNLKNAEKAGAARYAPETYKAVKADLDAREHAIRANRYDKPLLADAKEAALRETERLQRITADAKRLGSEKVALEMEATNMQAQAARKEAAAKVEAERQAAAQAQEQASSLNKELQGAQERLQAQQAMEQKYQQARALFSPDEADVYRQGDNLLIRLKGLQFARGKADLSDANEGLVQKVAQAVALFGEPAVKVEGYTDATGSHATNVRLSDERAKAVKQALQEATQLPDVKMSSEGFGDAHPIASNKTAEGRAQNRRVDVVIVPEASAVAH